MLEAMAPLLAEGPIDTVVNTHSDGDHWWGNQEVAGAEIVATEAAAAVMAKQSPTEMKRFGALAGALRLAGSMPLPIPGAARSGRSPPTSPRRSRRLHSRRCSWYRRPAPSLENWNWTSAAVRSA